MIKAAFFLDNKNLPSIDYEKVLEGNPGIGGSEYEFILVSYLLEKRNNGIESYFFSNSKVVFPHVHSNYVGNLSEACENCIKNDIPVLIIDIKAFDKLILDNYEGKLSFGIWAHNNASYSLLTKLYKMPSVKKIINCGREEMELYRDHIATIKSVYIYNMFPIKDKAQCISNIKKANCNHNVVYMGSLIPSKGFGLLAEAWKDVLKNIPDAELYVIGSGNLYNNNAKLGEWGIAEDNFEKSFIPYLIGDDGNLLPSVHFMGKMGDEKLDVLSKAKVGVPNPTGETETFCICAIEMQLMGCNITTIYHPAYLDTVYNKEYLYKHKKELSKYIVRRLEAQDDDFNSVYDFISKNFSIEANITKWEYLLEHIDDEMVREISQYNYGHKKIKNILFFIKKNIPLLKFFPCVGQLYSLKNKIKSIL